MKPVYPFTGHGFFMLFIVTGPITKQIRAVEPIQPIEG